jgi:Tfp pilus assembly protein PilF
VNADALVEMGTIFLTAGKTTDAVTLFDLAVEQDPNHAEAHFRRALGLLALGRPGEARAGFERVLELKPGSPAAEKARQALEQLPPAAAGEAR